MSSVKIKMATKEESKMPKMNPNRQAVSAYLTYQTLTSPIQGVFKLLSNDACRLSKMMENTGYHM